MNTQALLTHLQHHLPGLLAVYLFGSHAQGTAGLTVMSIWLCFWPAKSTLCRYGSFQVIWRISRAVRWT